MFRSGYPCLLLCSTVSRVLKKNRLLQGRTITSPTEAAEYLNLPVDFCKSREEYNNFGNGIEKLMSGVFSSASNHDSVMAPSDSDLTTNQGHLLFPNGMSLFSQNSIIHYLGVYICPNHTLLERSVWQTLISERHVWRTVIPRCQPPRLWRPHRASYSADFLLKYPVPRLVNNQVRLNGLID
jgi:hypothetical protein